MPAKTNANDVPDAIDIEELTRNLEGAKAECSYDYRLARCPCHRHASLFLMEALAPRLARRVVADAAKLREVRAALGAARKVNHRYDHEAAVDAILGTAIAALEATS